MQYTLANNSNVRFYPEVLKRRKETARTGTQRQGALSFLSFFLELTIYLFTFNLNLLG